MTSQESRQMNSSIETTEPNLRSITCSARDLGRFSSVPSLTAWIISKILSVSLTSESKFLLRNDCSFPSLVILAFKAYRNGVLSTEMRLPWSYTTVNYIMLNIHCLCGKNYVVILLFHVIRTYPIGGLEYSGH